MENTAKYKLTLAEQETIIRYDAETKQATVYSVMPSVVRQLDKLAAEFPDTYKLLSSDPNYGAKRYTVPASFIRFGKPMSDARREKARQNAISRGFGQKRSEVTDDAS